MTSTPTGRTGVDTIVLVHGLWLTPRCWEGWVDRYRRAGFRVLAPAWPGLDTGVEQLRRDPTPIAALTAQRVLAHYERLVGDLNGRPFLVGHSFGAAFVQVLLDRGLGAAGVAVNPVPVRGVVRFSWRMTRSLAPLLRRPGNRRRALPLSPEKFQQVFANTVGAETADGLYQRYHVPGAGGVLFDLAWANLRRRSAFDVDFGDNSRPPLLLIGGTADNLAPPSVTRSIANHHRKSTALTGYREFSGRSHLSIAEPGWQEIADYALEWAIEAAPRRQRLSTR
jgi:pimeloyl-ACP methyl ester carboxylesterase